jgi:hypothetical protein
MMTRGRLVFSRNRSEGQYEAQSIDQLVVYVCARVPREGWLPEAHLIDPLKRKVIREVDLAQYPVPLNEAKRRCDAHHHEHIRKIGIAEDIEYIDRWPLGEST